MEFIEFKNVTREYNAGNEKIKALNDVSFTIRENTFTVILGPSDLENQLC